jgi:hypothetical protein
VEPEKKRRRKFVYSARRDPVTYFDAADRFIPGSWREIFSDTGWRPGRAVVIPRRDLMNKSPGAWMDVTTSKLDAETIRWLAEFNRLNPK